MTDRDYLLYDRYPSVVAFDRTAEYLPPIRHIQKEVCLEYGVTLLDMISRRKTRRVVEARQYAMWRARHETLSSYPEIGRAFDRDHTTVMRAVRKLDNAAHI